MELNTRERELITEFRDTMIANNPKQTGKLSPKALDKWWKEKLVLAWLNDWPEQRGELRALRNDPKFGSISEIIKAF